MYAVYTIDRSGVKWYFKSKWLGYNWTTDIKEAKKYKEERLARGMIRQLWSYDRGWYRVDYLY
jgi:hypothetical protein